MGGGGTFFLTKERVELFSIPKWGVKYFIVHHWQVFLINVIKWAFREKQLNLVEIKYELEVFFLHAQ